jgi:hypothetical protein
VKDVLSKDEVLRRIIMATSSLNEISTDQLGNRVVVRGRGVTLPAPSLLFLQQASEYQ